MLTEKSEIFIPGPAGRIHAKYNKSNKKSAPIALVLQPHPQYGGTMNNKITFETYKTFYDNDFSVCRINFRGVGKSDGHFDNGQGELSDAAASLDWLEKENIDYSQCWVSGFSFGALICMQLLMRRPEINRFVAISPQPNVYDFSFLAPCPSSGLIVYGKNDELVPEEYILVLKKRLEQQKGIKVPFKEIENANHFYKNKVNDLQKILNQYIQEETSLY
ncbi:MAG: alpha/beta hydrolase [Candidatus Pelagibacter sp. TMED64]|nr:alpha/beta hydrolase [Candidatus Pelagibacter sp.]OUU67587.1 MAG: alpha/beta hydrolase [Candidatus Pelagibacter sp. TMED64]|tara:strand:- start:54 stop:710 length:657 start_codon:yes stop_codon:yes gene_type:complete